MTCCVIWQCNTDSGQWEINSPEGFPPIPFPEDNVTNEWRFSLGKKLFFDPILSFDSTISCASCHKPSLAFADSLRFSSGVLNGKATRNTPSLQNVAYLPYYLSEGSVPTLEMQSQVPIQEANEFNHNILLIAEKMNKIPAYVDLSQKAYGRLPDPFVISRSIASYERAILSGNSRYDLFLRDSSRYPLTEQEKLGKSLFYSDQLKCSYCHSGFLFTNSSFQNTGLYYSYADPGRYRFTKDSLDLARFKVPGLRNVEITAPYMHDGSIPSLEQVVNHYALGIRKHPNQNAWVSGFTISVKEKEALISFLKSLTDHSFLRNTFLLNE